MNAPSARPVLFHANGFWAVELNVEDVPWLQQFFEENREYFFAVGGRPPEPTAAREEIHGLLPEGWAFTKRWLIGICNQDGAMVAMANVVSDLLAPHVWHIGLFIVATSLHGTGIAKSLYGALETWMEANGAEWLRLGVVRGDTRAERFWEASSFVELRTREKFELGARINTLRVMAKSLRGGRWEQYLALVPRDRPEA